MWSDCSLFIWYKICDINCLHLILKQKNASPENWSTISKYDTTLANNQQRDWFHFIGVHVALKKIAKNTLLIRPNATKKPVIVSFCHPTLPVKVRAHSTSKWHARLWECSNGIATGGQVGQSVPCQRKFAKIGKRGRKSGKRGKNSGKRGKIGKVFSLCPSWQIWLATLLRCRLCVVDIPDGCSSP